MWITRRSITIAWCPTSRGLFGDVNLRQALAYALDKDIIAKALGDMP